MIQSFSLDLDRGDVAQITDVPELVATRAGSRPLRWAITRADDATLTLEVSRRTGSGRARAHRTPVVRARASGATAVVNVIPTGIGCAVGGFAADAGPATKLLGGCADHVISHPNAVNGSDLFCGFPNLVYAEGFFLDAFLAGGVELFLPRANRIGVVLGRDDQEALDHAINVVNAVRAVHGVDVVDIEVTDVPIGARCVRMASGAYSGSLPDEEPLLGACRRLVASGATAIAIASTIEDLPPVGYARHFAGEEPNPVGGAEAVVSRLVSSHFDLPAAHAPLTNFRAFDLADPIVDARGAAEAISPSGLASVLVGLHRAPHVSPPESLALTGVLTLRDVLAVVAPASALGGAPVLHALRHGIPVIAVLGNETVLDVTAGALGVDVEHVLDYVEAAGAVVALRDGISLESVRRPLPTLDPLAAEHRRALAPQ